MGLLDAPFLPRDSLGTKLRRLAVLARANDPFAKSTIVAPAAWTASTAVYPGQVRTVGVNQYIYLSAGTTSVSAGPTTTLARGVSDGTAICAYFGRVQIAATDPTAPAYSSGNTVPSGLTNVYYAFTNATAFRLYGAYATNNSGSANINRFTQNSAALVAQGDARLAFWTDSPKFSLMVPAGGNEPRVRIDGRFYSNDSLAFVSSGTGYHLFDFTSSGGRKPRLIEIDIQRFGLTFTGVAVGPLDQVWAPTDQDPITAVWISDSIWAGSGYGPFAHTVPQIVSAKLGWSDCWNYSIGGTGWLNTGTGTGSPFYTFRQRIAEAVTRSPDIIVLQGSVNDSNNGSTANQITAEVTATLQAIRTAGSKALIIVMGVWSTDATSGIGTGGVETAVQAGVTAFNDPLRKTYFIPIVADPVLPWVTTTLNNSAKTVSVNYTQLLASDNTHPTESGTMYLAERTVRAITANLLGVII